MCTIEITATAVAWYGALVATAALMLSGWAAWRDRARIVVTGKTGVRVSPGGPYDPSREYILITVANRGRRPRTIDKVALKLRANGFIVAADCTLYGPQGLTEGRGHTWFIEQAGFCPEDIEYLLACDQTGKEFRGKLQRS